MELLEVRNLSVEFERRGRPTVKALNNVSFTVGEGTCTGLVGESGCGKSVTSLAMMGLLPERGVRVTGEILYKGVDLLTLRRAELRRMRGREIAMIFQDPLTSLNPVVKIGVQISEILSRREKAGKSSVERDAVELIKRVGIADPSDCLRKFPHELSGGMRQRILIAMALACEPGFIIADEPTTALDVTVQAQILELMRQLIAESGTTLLLITHDMGVVAEMCDALNVMYAGKVIESADCETVFDNPMHPYSDGLLRSTPRLDNPRGEPLYSIPGSIADHIEWSEGCAFAPRCAYRQGDCVDGAIERRWVGSHSHRCLHPLGKQK